MVFLFHRFPDLVESDKILHYLASFFLTIFATIGFTFLMESGTALAAGLVASFVVGIGKELFDKYIQHETFDVIDLTFDFFGVAMAAIAMSIFI